MAKQLLIGISGGGVLHTDAAATAAALQDLLGVPLSWSSPAHLVL